MAKWGQQTKEIRVPKPNEVFPIRREGMSASSSLRREAGRVAFEHVALSKYLHSFQILEISQHGNTRVAEVMRGDSLYWEYDVRDRVMFIDCRGFKNAYGIGEKASSYYRGTAESLITYAHLNSE